LCSTSIASSTFSTSRLSVSSISSRPGASPLARSAPLTDFSNPSLRNWREERLTETRTGGWPGVCQVFAQ
jgi:hypothetical protein